jgi:PAS domain S-box-containing protein
MQGERAIGVLAVQSYTAGVRYEERDKEILQFVSIQVATAIERKRSAEALRESELRARTLFETVNLIVLGLDASGTVEYVNPYYLALTGFAAGEVIGASWFDRCIPEGQRVAVRDAVLQLLERNAHTHYQNSIMTKAGEERMVAWSNTVIRDASGKATGTLSIGEDVTARSELEQQLRQAQKMEAVGRLAGGIAHDFNNLLTAIFGYSDLLGEELPPDSPAQADLGEIRTAATRAAALTRQLLAFSRQQVLQPVVLSMNDVIENLENMLQRVLGEDIELATHTSRDLGNVKADPGQLEQVIMNLAVNARDAMPTGGKLTIETSNVSLSGEYAEAHRPVASGDYVMLAVSDSGIGMDETVKTRLFEPFFTTKGVGAGTGLGLATVYGIVKQSGGYIWVYSEPGHGATFKVYLPRVQAPVDEIKQAPLPAVNLGGTETILLAEDEELLRPLARELLVRLGYRVLEATNAAEALDLARAHPEEIHLLVSDVVMPGQSGLQLARQLSAERPHMKVLYMSGYTDEAIVRHGLLDPGTNFLQKPFTPTVLARKVREVLDSK